MMDNTLLKKTMIESGRLDENQIARAEDYALTAGMTLEESVIFLKLLNYSALGQCLAEIHQKPYFPLLGKSPIDIARSKVSLKTAESLLVFPLDYEAKSNTITLAVSNPEDPEVIKQLRKAIPSSMTLEVAVASKPEILMAIDVYYRGRPYIPEPELHIPKGFLIVSRDAKSRETPDFDEEAKSGSRILLLEPDLERSRALMTLLRREGFPNVKWAASVKEALRACDEEPVDRIVVNGRTFKSQGNTIKQLSRHLNPSMMSFYNIRNLLLAQEHPYAQMSASLTSLVAFIIRRALHDQEERLSEVIATARYCKLLAMRIGLPAVMVDGSVMAAWLSVPGIGRIIYDHMASPYSLDEIFESDETATASARMEVQILRIVKKYQSLKKEMPEMAGDMDKVRKNIALASGKPEDRALLEAFLNVIKDDEFLKDVGRSQRRILIVDPDYSQDSALAIRLSNDGYEVIGVADAKAASQVIFNSGTDAVISEVNLPGTDGLQFCRALRENSASARLPFFFLADEEGERIATQCLEAGADDFFKKPPDLEMMSIKIRNLIALKSTRGTRSGISGTLKDMSFTDIIQSLTTGDKDVEIRLQSGNQKGVIYLQQGEVIYAKAQGAEGQDAFYRMMTWQDGEFEITACHAIPPRNIYESAMSLLMEGARIADDETGLPDEEA
jgi:DNA-binding response OmpR family regulator